MSPTLDELKVRAVEFERGELKQEIRHAERVMDEEFEAHGPKPEIGYCMVCDCECPSCEEIAADPERAWSWAESNRATRRARAALETVKNGRARLRTIAAGAALKTVAP